jgi:hypothetical protein
MFREEAQIDVLRKLSHTFDLGDTYGGIEKHFDALKLSSSAKSWTGDVDRTRYLYNMFHDISARVSAFRWAREHLEVSITNIVRFKVQDDFGAAGREHFCLEGIW